MLFPHLEPQLLKDIIGIFTNHKVYFLVKEHFSKIELIEKA